MLRYRTAEKDFSIVLRIGQRPHLLGQAPLRDHIACNFRRPLDVIGRPGGDPVQAEDQLFGQPAAEQRADLRIQILLGVAVAIVLWQEHGDAQGAPSRDDRDLVHRVVLGDRQTDDGMTCLVIGGEFLVLIRHDHGFALSAHHDLVLGLFEVVVIDQLLVSPGGKQRGLVNQVGQICAGEPGRRPCNHARLDVRGQRYRAHMHFENLLATTNIGQRNHHLTVKPARTQQRGIQHIRTVGCRNDDHALAALEPIHLDQQLVQGLLALVVTASQTGPTLTANRINFIDEDDAG